MRGRGMTPSGVGASIRGVGALALGAGAGMHGTIRGIGAGILGRATITSMIHIGCGTVSTPISRPICGEVTLGGSTIRLQFRRGMRRELTQVRVAAARKSALAMRALSATRRQQSG